MKQSVIRMTKRRFFMAKKADQYETLRKELDPLRLLQEARDAARLSDYGDESFFGPFAKLMDCVSREVDFHAEGLKAYKTDIIRLLVNKLRMHADLQRHPEILDEDVSDPIIIFGIPRSGTTKLQRLLAASPDVQRTLLWRLLNPAPFPDAQPGQPDPRIAAAGNDDRLTGDKSNLHAAHHYRVDQTEEESMLFKATFDDWVCCTTVPIPSFSDWLLPRTATDRAKYRYVRTVFQYLQWQDGGKRNRPWVLKATSYMGCLDVLLETYPNAVLLHCHRDPYDAIVSLMQLLENIWKLKSNADIPEIAASETLKWWPVVITRYLEARDRLRLDGKIIDVRYEQVRTDPMPIVREAFKRTGQPLSAAAEQQVLKWDKEHEQHRFGKHTYSSERYGITREKITDLFGDYIYRFKPFIN